MLLQNAVILTVFVFQDFNFLPGFRHHFLTVFIPFAHFNIIGEFQISILICVSI